MNFIKNNLANAFTLGNLFFGCIGVVNLIIGNYHVTAMCMIISLILDFFDGFIARALKSNSNLGIQLDSLADMVSFGFLPGTALFVTITGGNYDNIPWYYYLTYAVTVFSGLRLAIFNLDEDQKYYFKGLNTPTNAILIFGLFYCYKESHAFSFIFDNNYLILLLSFLCSYLLVSPIKMIALKFKSKKLNDNYPKLALFIGIIALICIYGTVGIPLSVIYYIVISLIFQKKLV